MPRATIIYDLDNPDTDDRDNLDMALNGYKFRSVLYSVMEMWIRPKIKHGIKSNNEPLTSEEYKLLEDLQEFILDELHDKELTLTSLY